MHIGYGGGLFFLPFNALALNLSYCRSQETGMLQFGTGFLF
jgi:hypothetical protein